MEYVFWNCLRWVMGLLWPATGRHRAVATLPPPSPPSRSAQPPKPVPDVAGDDPLVRPFSQAHARRRRTLLIVGGGHAATS